MTLRARLTAAFVAVVLVPLVLGVVLVTRLVPPAVETRQLAGLADTAQAVSTVLAGLCPQARSAASVVGQARAGLPPAELQASLGRQVAGGLADGLQVRDAGGRLIGQSGTVPTQVPVDCRDGGTPTEALVTAVVERRGPAGTVVGAAVASYRVDTALATLLRDATRKEVVVLLAGDRVVARTGEVTPELLTAARAADGQGVVQGGDAAVFRPATGDQPLGVLLVEPMTEGPPLMAIAWAVLGGALVLAWLIGTVLARATTRPLEQLSEAAARIAAGDLETTIDVRSRDEVGTLAAAFNHMTNDLRRHVGALQASRDELEAGLARLGDALSGTHDLDRILTVVLETAIAAVQAQAGSVLLLGPDRSELVLRVGRGLEGRGVAAPMTMPWGCGVAGRVALSGEAVVGRVGRAPDGPGAPQTPADPGALVLDDTEPASSTVIAVPLRSNGHVIGVLTLHDRVDDGVFDEHDLATIRAFAAQATVAVDNVALHEEAQRLSITDGLTGLWNYRYFTMSIAKEIERAARFGRPLVLLMIDVDHFKLINDRYGHPRGDAVLVEVAARVRALVRDVDTVARYGGEEIVIVLPETDGEGAQLAAARLCDAVRRRPFGDPGQEPITVTVSVGAAVFPLHGVTPSELLHAADEALYDAKTGGRDTWRVVGPDVLTVQDTEVR